MDKRIRSNEVCIIGLPRCDFVFSSTRNCFIGYGFNESKLEMTILKALLEKEGIQPTEAGGEIAPGQHAFCVKICSKIITSQFCIILLNNDMQENREVPNANINIEYGLMLGFNKYVIPFQRKSQKLPFNVADLDTMKYNNTDFEDKAEKAIKKAIDSTKQDKPQEVSFDQIIATFIMIKKAMITSIQDIGNKNIYDLGSPLGFYLLNDFKGLTYIFLGNFSALRAETILWRVKMLTEVISERLSSIGHRIKSGILTEEQGKLFKEVLEKTEVWLIVNSGKEKSEINALIKKVSTIMKIQVFSRDDVASAVKRLIQ